MGRQRQIRTNGRNKQTEGEARKTEADRNQPRAQERERCAGGKLHIGLPCSLSIAVSVDSKTASIKPAAGIPPLSPSSSHNRNTPEAKSGVYQRS
jgi:hypothetical protein